MKRIIEFIKRLWHRIRYKYYLMPHGRGYDVICKDRVDMSERVVGKRINSRKEGDDFIKIYRDLWNF